MKIEEIIENEDGTCTITFDLKKEETQLLLEWAIKKALEEYCERITEHMEVPVESEPEDLDKST